MNEKLRSQFTPSQPLMAASQNVNRENLGREVHASKKDKINKTLAKKTSQTENFSFRQRESADFRACAPLCYICIGGQADTVAKRCLVSDERDPIRDTSAQPASKDSTIEDSGSRARSVICAGRFHGGSWPMSEEWPLRRGLLVISAFGKVLGNPEDCLRNSGRSAAKR